MISVPPGIQSQLGEAVSVIADSDFWENWDTLVDVSCNRAADWWTFTESSLGPCVKAIAS